MFPTDYSISPAELAAAAEERGFESLWLPEHSHIPASRRTPFPGGGELPKMYYDVMEPFVALASAAAATRTLRLATGVCLVPQRDPIQTAKSVASLDRLSNGRFLFGVGAGWNAEEMENHGGAFAQRGLLLRERVEAMKEIWTRSKAEYHGKLVDFAPLMAWPKPVQKPHPPIHVGGGWPMRRGAPSPSATAGRRSTASATSPGSSPSSASSPPTPAGTRPRSRSRSSACRARRVRSRPTATRGPRAACSACRPPGATRCCRSSIATPSCSPRCRMEPPADRAEERTMAVALRDRSRNRRRVRRLDRWLALGLLAALGSALSGCPLLFLRKMALKRDFLLVDPLDKKGPRDRFFEWRGKPKSPAQSAGVFVAPIVLRQPFSAEGQLGVFFPDDLADSAGGGAASRSTRKRSSESPSSSCASSTW